MFTLPVISGTVYIYDVEVIKYLREKYNIGGVLSGILPQYPQQNKFGGLPLKLSPEEALYLLETNEFEFFDDTETHLDEYKEKVDEDKPDTKNGQSSTTSNNKVELAVLSKIPKRSSAVKLKEPVNSRYAVYKYLVQKGYFVLPGLRFGCHYMAYPGDIMRYHSHYNVLGLDYDEGIDLLTMVSGGRLATSVKKCWVIGAKNPETEETEAFSIEWSGFG
ncbi:tRNA splicing endonuclease subunit [Starmerella bacillaris]|uniref:tRNA-splicing endonuclease subunit SEN34 n=1 Tax=Starmerella bacillaris TaxID=1247836 RepID=A0AAV5RHZ0_STABA|nr:tRNA splicing endonuclease subunit [Starmerella bacillaris]